ncbi:response regulator [Phragmitibacter flavus]|uniref:histidine kinase n=1 Tax=Phragmitibacter flavus TaxID=2576071 RepID=A0A5R8KAP5_9BACT|nr:ATP-binding protein [Phragmitibacter flavus]TLD69384.1 response regulator [Phragmitibacter flavus]
MEKPPDEEFHLLSPKGLLPSFAIVGTVTLVCLAMMYLTGLRVISVHQQINRKEESLSTLHTVIQTIQAAESAQRGYLLTGKRHYLEPYELARKELDADLASLKDFRPVHVDQLTTLAREKMAGFAKIIQLREAGNLDAAMAIINTDKSENSTSDMLFWAQLMNSNADAELDRLLHLTERLAHIRTTLFGFSSLITLGFLAWAYRRIRREIETSHHAASRYLQQKEILAVALTSIGDGVIMTDQHAKITLMNKVAETLTGWTSAEAMGRDCREVYHIISEESRTAVENPVHQVLHSRQIIGPTDPTLLIRRDGTELPVDDSGAPIRDQHGNLHGVVLVFRDFTQHRQLETSLRSAKEAAETANDTKDNFLAALSHELRTPLTPVVATLAGWETDPALPGTLLPTVQMMRRNIELEARLIDDLLDLTRIVKGKLPLNLEPVDLHQLIHSISQILDSEIHSKNLRLTLHLNATSHHAMVDTGRMQQVFLNILKNATKFTPENGTIEITTRQTDTHIHTILRDNGIGMTPEMLTRLFRPFEQGTEQSIRRYGGLGLGMSISKALVEAQNGDIQATSEGPDQGSTFTVILPLITEPQPSIATSQPPPSKPQTQDQVALEILLVEDHVDTARVLTHLLTRSGHRVVNADTVATALATFSQHPFDLLLCDLGLPDGSGLNIIRTIRQTSSLPAIALTGYGMEEDIEACKTAGFNAHLTKPLNLQKLKEVISSVTAPAPLS